jgi:hypothetical protein
MEGCNWCGRSVLPTWRPARAAQTAVVHLLRRRAVDAGHRGAGLSLSLSCNASDKSPRDQSREFVFTMDGGGGTDHGPRPQSPPPRRRRCSDRSAAAPTYKSDSCRRCRPGRPPGWASGQAGVRAFPLLPRSCRRTAACARGVDISPARRWCVSERTSLINSQVGWCM